MTIREERRTAHNRAQFQAQGLQPGYGTPLPHPVRPARCVAPGLSRMCVATHAMLGFGRIELKRRTHRVLVDDDCVVREARHRRIEEPERTSQEGKSGPGVGYVALKGRPLLEAACQGRVVRRERCALKFVRNYCRLGYPSPKRAEYFDFRLSRAPED